MPSQRPDAERGTNVDGSASAALLRELRRIGVVPDGETPSCEPLPGGVSSEIWRVDLASGLVCVKRALPTLKVAADWQAPVERNAYEVRWMETAGGIVPGAALRVLGHDAAAGLFVMEYCDPVRFRLWKDELAAGRADTRFAAQVGDRIGRVHAGTADDPAVAARFPTDAIFHAIRLEPYLEATARVHPDRAQVLADLVAVTAGTKRTLVHGDVSPKNILMGPRGPVFLDAECAWFGDPAFDLAFCLNHLLLKCLWVPAAARGFLSCFDALLDAYRPHVHWEAPAELERRAARLLPGLLLARVDGKSPLEYLTQDAEKDLVRRVARRLLVQPVDGLGEVRRTWAEELTGG